MGVRTVETEKLLNFCCDIGRDLMQNGAEIYRVEESIQHILDAYGCPETEVFAIPSCIIVNIQEGEKNYTKSVRIRTAANNLRKLDRLNALCWDICRETPPVEENRRRLAEVMEEPRYPRGVSYLAYGLTAFFFTLFWGGRPIDAAAAFPCGMIVKWTLSTLGRVRANVFFTNLLAGMLMALPPLLLHRWVGGINVDKCIIGTIMLLVPGIAITNVVRDVLAGDFLTAVTRLAEVLIVAMGIAVGVAMAITGVRMGAILLAAAAQA